MAKDQQQRGGCFCKPENRGKGLLGRTSSLWCSCGFKIRSKGHKEGMHHNKRVPTCKKR